MNKILIFSFLFLCSCSKDYSKLSYLDPYIEKENYTSREPAQNLEDDLCFIDSYPIDVIKSEIKVMEKMWEKEVKVPAPFNKLKLKPAESHYINRFNKYIYQNSTTLDCDSLPCVLNVAYGNPNADEGYRIYHWFLKMGSGISTKDDIPSYTRDSEVWKGKTLKDFLFTDDELKLMNLTSKIVSPKYKNILVSTIHRFPDGSTPGTNVAGLYMGFRGARQKPHREIILTNQPIRFDKSTKLIKGFFIHTIIHELTHALDFTYGKKGTFDDFSDAEKWKNLSWKFGEATVTKVKVVDGVEVEYEDTIMTWIPDNTKKDGFMRFYQMTSPGEDFAEVGAYFIVSPESLYEKSPNKYEIFKSDFNLDKDFKEESVEKEYRKVLEVEFKDKIWEVVKNCALGNTKVNKKSNYVRLDSQFSYLDNSVTNCIEVELESSIFKSSKDFYTSNYYACNLKSKLDQSITGFVGAQTPALSQALDQVSAYADIKVKWKQMKSDLKSNCDPVNIYIQNFNKINSSVYYQEELVTCSESILSQYGAENTLFKELSDDYIKNNEYEITSQNTKDNFLNLTKGYKTELLSAVKALVKSCPVRFDENLDSSTPVDGGAVFVNASVLNCINRNYLEEFDNSLKVFLDNKYHLSDEALLYISSIYKNDFTQFINDELLEISQLEYKKYVQALLEPSSSVALKIINSKESQKIALFELELNRVHLGLLKLIKDEVVKDWKKLGYPKTISINETVTQLYHILLEKLLEKAKLSQTQELKNLETRIVSDANNLYSDLDNSSVWSQSTLTEADFKNKCQHIAKEKLSNISYDSSSFYFNTLDTIKLKISDSACERHFSNFKNELQLLENAINTFVEENKLYENLNWRIVSTKDSYVSGCQNQFKTTLANVLSKMVYFKSFDLNQDLKLGQACDASYTQWETEELDLIAESMNCNGECNKVPKSFNFIKSKWLSFRDKFLEEIVFSKEVVFKELYQKEVQKCNDLYPNTRYAVMRMKKDKCIEDINLKNLSFNSGEIHPKIAKMISDFFTK